MTPAGCGLGLRREVMPALLADIPPAIDFLEIAPENWMGAGGRMAHALRQLTERRPFVCHGLSLSLGGPAPLDTALLRQVRAFMATHGIGRYTEHLSWCSDAEGQLYELLPLPFTDEAVRHVAARIRQAQDVLGQRIAIENASTYLRVPAGPAVPMDEASFVAAVLREADCDLHLDVNNVYVNSRNHGFDPQAYLAALPADRVVYMHVAGHLVEPDGLVIDTHGDAVCDPVWALLADAYARFGVVPTCLERDFDVPPLPVLLDELTQIERCQRHADRHPQAA